MFNFELENELYLCDGVSVEDGTADGEVHRVERITLNDNDEVELAMDDGDTYLFSDLHPEEMERVIVHLLDELKRMRDRRIGRPLGTEY